MSSSLTIRNKLNYQDTEMWEMTSQFTDWPETSKNWLWYFIQWVFFSLWEYQNIQLIPSLKTSMLLIAIEYYFQSILKLNKNFRILSIIFSRSLSKKNLSLCWYLSDFGSKLWGFKFLLCCYIALPLVFITKFRR